MNHRIRMFSTAAITAAVAIVGPLASPADAAGHHRTVNVHNAAGLAQALKHVTSGTTIRVAPGRYLNKSGWKITKDCRSRCTLVGTHRARLTSGSMSGAYGLNLIGASGWTVRGVTVRNSGKGVVLDHSSGNRLTHLRVAWIGDEGIHLRGFSSENMVDHNAVHHTGRKQPGFGEGLYVGSAHSNWGKYSSGDPDVCFGNKLLANRVWRTGAENIDLKEGSKRTVVAYNWLDGRGMSGENYADSDIDVKANYTTVAHNTFKHVAKKGAYTVTPLYGYGKHNKFWGNHFPH